jgi:transcriptional regulator with XRE-family HTH domain
MGKERPPVPEVRSPTIRRRELGAMLRALRQEQGLTVDQVAEKLLCSPSKVSRMETGQRGATLRDVRDLARIYGLTDQDKVDNLMNLARAGREHGWWQSYNLDFATYVGLEEAAVSLSFYMPMLIPGLLQTPGYVRALHEADIQNYTQERVQEAVEVRLKRQQILTRNPPLQLSVVLDEAVLHRVVGGPAVMGEQLDRLIAAGKLPNVTIHIVPFGVGAHPAMDSLFEILDFGDTAAQVVYVEGLMGYIYLDRAQDISRYAQVFDRLRAVALTPEESAGLIAKIRAQYKSVTPSITNDADG